MKMGLRMIKNTQMNKENAKSELDRANVIQ